MYKTIAAGVALVAGVSAIAYSQAAALPSVQAVRTEQLLGGFGVNTHFDFNQFGYQNVPQTIADILYLGGVKFLRDSPGNDSDLTTWPLVASQTGATFDAYIGEGAPAIYASELARMQVMRQSGTYVSMFEGGNEEDDSYPVGLHNSQMAAAKFQPQVFASAQGFGIPSINISFGAGWCDPKNDPTCAHGDYNTVGDLSASATLANAHTYPAQSPLSNNTFVNLNADAHLAASSRPVAITEYGWTTSSPTRSGWGNVSESTQAAYVLEGMLDAFQLGNPYYFYYALYDDNSGSFGLFSTSGQPKASAVAVHNFFGILNDDGSNAARFSPGSLSYSLTGLPQSTGIGGHQLLLQKSDGSFWLVVWNEEPLNALSDNHDLSVAPVQATLTLGSPAAVSIYDPLSGTSPIQTDANSSSISLRIPAHPIIIEIAKSAASPGAVTPVVAAPVATSTYEAQTFMTTNNVRVRSQPRIGNNILGVALLGEEGTQIGSSQFGSGYSWIDLLYKNGLSGWSVADFLKPITNMTVHTTSAGPVTSPPSVPSVQTITTTSSSSSVQPANAASPTAIPPVDTPRITVPASISAFAGVRTTVSSISVDDPFGAVNPGTLAFDASAEHGSVYLSGAKGSGGGFLSYAGPLASINSVAGQLQYQPTSGTTHDVITITVYNQAGMSASKTIAVTVSSETSQASTTTIPAPQDPAVNVPQALQAPVGSSIVVSGASVTDPFAALNPGTLALRISANTGTLSAPGARGNGSSSLALDAPLVDINAALEGLSYTAKQAGADTITVTVYNQAGLYTIKTISVSVQ